jgi:TldD protein
LRSLEDCLESKIVDQADLVQIRGQSRRLVTCKVKNSVIDDFSNISLKGGSARAFVDNRSWGFCSTNFLDPENVEETLKHAIKLAKASSKFKQKKIILEPIKIVERDEKTSIGKPLHDFSMEEISEIPLEAYRGAKDGGVNVADVKTTFIAIEDDKLFLSSEGSNIKQKSLRVMLFVAVLAKRNALICPASESLGHTGGMEIFDKTSPYSMGKKVAERALQLLDVEAPPSGKFQVVIDPTLCATMLHESIGHPLEADLAMSGGGFGNQIGQKVSSELITIYDSGHISGGLGHFFFDDEGVECKRTNLIEKGVLASFMHDRTSASISNVPPTGNAHAWDYSVEPLIRQTNIGIEPGKQTLDEMIEGVKDGFFLEGTFGGQADMNADFTFGFQNAQRIEKGRLTKEYRGANVAGNAIEVFKSIDAVSEESILRPGSCGKRQFAVQGRVVPAIRCQIMVGGSGGN